MKYTSINRQSAQVITSELRAILTEFAASRGLALRPSGSTFGPLDISIRFTLAVTETADGTSAAQAEWNKFCSLEGFTPTDFGSGFTANGKLFRISGIKPKRPVHCIQATGENGKEYLFAALAVKNARVKFTSAEMDQRNNMEVK